jgi:serine-type D-Ala-D-Ala endopeptidase (penicillin-binding protein 7)
MKYFLKHVVLCYVVGGLLLMPFSTMAETKKSTKVSSSLKHKTSVSKMAKNKTGKNQKIASKKSSANIKRVKYSVTSKQQNLHKSYVLSEPLPAINANDYDGTGALILSSAKALVINQNTNEVIYAKNTNTPTPIASVTKLMTAMVVLDSGLNLNDMITVTEDDRDYLKGTSSRLPMGTQLTRNELLHLALIASENRAASALSGAYPGGRAKFVSDMNIKAMSLGMMHTHFEDGTGLNSNNVSTAEDLARMVKAAYQYRQIREITTTGSYDIYLSNRSTATRFNNTNLLVRNHDGNDWQIGLSKTGYISEAGRCLVMQAKLVGEPVIIVLLDSEGKYTRIGDANRVKKWVEHNVVSGLGPVLTHEEAMKLGQAY